MNRLITFVLFATLALTSLTAFAQAACSATNTEPVKPVLEPITAQTRWLSPAGYIRWKHFQDNGSWITLEEANVIAKKGVVPAENKK